LASSASRSISSCARRSSSAACPATCVSMYTLLHYYMRQYLYFCTSKCAPGASPPPPAAAPQMSVFCTFLEYAYASVCQHTSASVSLRQLTDVSLLYFSRVRIRQHPSAYASIRQHTSAYVSLRQLTDVSLLYFSREYASTLVPIKQVKQVKQVKQERGPARPAALFYADVC
jgi:hypothetical protein